MDNTTASASPSTTSRFSDKIQTVRDTIAVYWTALVSVVMTDKLTSSVESSNIFSTKSRQRWMSSLENLLDQLLPSINENDSSHRSDQVDEIERVQRFFSTLICRLKLHGGLYFVVIKTRALQVKEDIISTSSQTIHTVSINLKQLMMFISKKSREQTTNVRECVQTVVSRTTQFTSEISTEVMKRIPAFEDAFSTLRIDDVASWMSIPKVKSQAEFVSALDQYLPSSMSSAVQRIVQVISPPTLEKSSQECKVSGNGLIADSLSTSSTESCSTPVNSDEANSGS